jgi:circadian clock protein KaiC
MNINRKKAAPKKAAPLKSTSAKVTIKRLPSGVVGLDEILGGGIPEFSFNIIAGSPGCGKTTLAHQIVFANATLRRPALYFTVLGEPAIKMLRYQQQYSFFDLSKVNQAVHFINLNDSILHKSFDEILRDITSEVEAREPGIVVVDSFRSVARRVGRHDSPEMDVQYFIQRLALLLTSWQATTFLIGEYTPEEVHGNSVFTVCDGLFWLTQNVERNSVVRKLQIMKLRGQASVPGLHSIRIGDYGLQAFSRTLGLTTKKTRKGPRRRLSCGIPALDQMLGGGILEGDSVLLAGPSGTGKSVLATQFVIEGLRAGEGAIIAIFEERPADYTARAATLGMDLTTPLNQGALELLYLRPLDLSVDETMQEILDGIKRTGAKRLVIDSLTGFEMALTPGFRVDFRESLYRMIVALTGVGVTIISTVEIEDSFTSFAFSQYAISFLTDEIIRLRYVEIEGSIRRVLVVVKTRAGDHSKEIREYAITDTGISIIESSLNEFKALTTGLPSAASSRSTSLGVSR